MSFADQLTAAIKTHTEGRDPAILNPLIDNLGNHVYLARNKDGHLVVAGFTKAGDL